MNVPGPHGFDSYVLQNRITFLCVLAVTLGLSTQIELDFIVGRAAHRKPRVAKKSADGMKTVEETTAGLAPADEDGNEN